MYFIASSIASSSKLPVSAPYTFSLKLPFVRENSGDYHVNPFLPGCPRIPLHVELRGYQKQAITSWFANNGRGTLKMATGSGKTITALAIAYELYKQIGLQVLLVVCPHRHLVTQWGRECEKFNLKPILAYENIRNWHSQMSVELYNLGSGYQKFLLNWSKHQ